MIDIDICRTPVRIPELRETVGLSVLFCVLCGIHLSLFRVSPAAVGYMSAGLVFGALYTGCAYFVTVGLGERAPGVSWQEMSGSQRFFALFLFITVGQLLLDISGIPGWIVTSALIGAALPFIVGSWLLVAFSSPSESTLPDS